MSTLWIGLWPVGWLSRLIACQQPLGEASSACCKERFLYTWQQYVIPGFYYMFILQAQQPLSGLVVSLGEKDYPAILGMLTAGRREGPPSHHPPGGSCQQITASGRGLGKGKAGEVQRHCCPGRLWHFSNSTEQRPPSFCCACPTEPHLSLLWLNTQSHPFCVAVGQTDRDGGAVVWTCVCGAGYGPAGVEAHTGAPSLGWD